MNLDVLAGELRSLAPALCYLLVLTVLIARTDKVPFAAHLFAASAAVVARVVADLSWETGVPALVGAAVFVALVLVGGSFLSGTTVVTIPTVVALVPFDHVLGVAAGVAVAGVVAVARIRRDAGAERVAVIAMDTAAYLRLPRSNGWIGRPDTPLGMTAQASGAVVADEPVAAAAPSGRRMVLQPYLVVGLLISAVL